MSPRFRSAFAAPTGFVAAVTRVKTKPAPRALVTRISIPRATAPQPSQSDCPKAA